MRVFAFCSLYPLFPCLSTFISVIGVRGCLVAWILIWTALCFSVCLSSMVFSALHLREMDPLDARYQDLFIVC
ncbi:hypothetical protein BJX65DRAFT_232563 [Aspergillus insuetus]